MTTEEEPKAKRTQATVGSPQASSFWHCWQTVGIAFLAGRFKASEQENVGNVSP